MRPVWCVAVSLADIDLFGVAGAKRYHFRRLLARRLVAECAVCISARFGCLRAVSAVPKERKPGCCVGVFGDCVLAVCLSAGVLQDLFPVLFCHLYGEMQARWSNFGRLR